MPDFGPTPELGRPDFLAADALERRNRKAALPRSLKRKLDDLCDAYVEAKVEMHGESARSEAQQEVAMKIMFGERVVSAAAELARFAAGLGDYDPYSLPALRAALVEAAFQWPLDVPDGIAKAAAEHQLEVLK